MRIGMLTGGGDCPGLNAVIRAVVRTAAGRYGSSVVGFRDGWRGLLEDRKVVLSNDDRIDRILTRGGTILGTARVNPDKLKAGLDQIRQTLDDNGIDALIPIGGEGTLTAASWLAESGVPVIGVPKTIDNDIDCTDVTFGFDTALSIATDAIDRLHTTAESHQRVMLVEVMGRHAGWIALHSGLATGAHLTLVPEVPFDVGEVCSLVKKRFQRGDSHFICVVAEGATPTPESMSLREGGIDEFGHKRFTGVAQQLGERSSAASARRCGRRCSGTCSAVEPRRRTTGCSPPASGCTPPTRPPRRLRKHGGPARHVDRPRTPPGGDPAPQDGAEGAVRGGGRIFRLTAFFGERPDA